jgi:hypothetical protein
MDGDIQISDVCVALFVQENVIGFQVSARQQSSTSGAWDITNDQKWRWQHTCE